VAQLRECGGSVRRCGGSVERMWWHRFWVCGGSVDLGIKPPCYAKRLFRTLPLILGPEGGRAKSICTI
jgi:hypothetical protein